MSDENSERWVAPDKNLTNPWVFLISKTVKGLCPQFPAGNPRLVAEDWNLSNLIRRWVESIKVLHFFQPSYTDCNSIEEGSQDKLSGVSHAKRFFG